MLGRAGRRRAASRSRPASRVSYTRTRPSGVTRSTSARSGMTKALSGSAGSSAIGKPKSDGRPVADVAPRRARVVGAVDAAVELHEQPLRAAGRAVEVVDAEVDRVALRLVREVAGDDALVAVAPRRAAVVGQPDADGRDREREPVRIARPRHDRVQAEPAAAGLPVRSRRVLPERALQLPRRAAVAALEQDARVAAGVQRAVVLAGDDDPDPLERRRRRPPAARRRRPAPTRPPGRRRARSAGRRSADVTRASTRPVRGSRIAYSTGSPANARARTANAPPGSPSRTNRPFLVPTSSSVIGSRPS